MQIYEHIAHTYGWTEYLEYRKIIATYTVYFITAEQKVCKTILV